MSQSNTYIKGLDGVRGISAVLVILTHLHLIGFGWMVMQMFFVMSGFLITRILLGMRDQHGLGSYLRVFYMRRALRIFPIYYLVIGTVIAATFVVDGMQRERDQSVFALLYVWNWFAISHDGKLAHTFEHFWSLAVEEQFYLCWPLLVYFVRGRRFWQVCLGILCVAPFLRLGSALMWPHLDGVLDDMPKALYQMSTTHVDAFATGALLCLLVDHPLSRRFRPSHLVVATLIAYLLGVMVSGPGINRHGPYNLPFTFGYPIHLGEHWQFVWGYSVVNLLSGATILLVAQGRLLTWVFQNPLIKRMGQVSYGAYIIHLPILMLVLPAFRAIQSAAGSPYWGTWIAAVPLLILVFGLADLLFRHFESRFLVLKDTHFGSGSKPGQAARTPDSDSKPSPSTVA